jgi:hypothetical protein
MSAGDLIIAALLFFGVTFILVTEVFWRVPLNECMAHVEELRCGGLINSCKLGVRTCDTKGHVDNVAFVDAMLQRQSEIRYARSAKYLEMQRE